MEVLGLGLGEVPLYILAYARRWRKLIVNLLQVFEVTWHFILRLHVNVDLTHA